MADLQNRATVVDIEATISRLRGVASSRIVTDSRGDITEVHVVADESRHPKQLSRDIESALLSEFDIRIDHRKISIAQLRGMGEAAAGETAADVRLKFLGIDYSLNRTTRRARVSVGHGDESYTGAAAMSAGARVEQAELVARATLEAVQEFLRSSNVNGGPVGLELRDLCTSQINGSPVLTVTVRIMMEKGEEELVGSALVRDDPWRAAASATLDALNRRLAMLRC